MDLTLSEKREIVFAELKLKKQIRALFRVVSVEEMEEMASRFQSVVDEMRLEEAKMALESEKARLEKEGRIDEVLSQIDLSGVDLESLVKVARSKKTRAKYYKDGHFWTGLGRRPLAFKGLTSAELEKYRVK